VDVQCVGMDAELAGQTAGTSKRSQGRLRSGFSSGGSQGQGRIPLPAKLAPQSNNPLSRRALAHSQHFLRLTVITGRPLPCSLPGRARDDDPVP
jgi:hypothetical protein